MPPEPLCESCRWSTVIRGPRTADELEQMEEVALMLKSEPRRTQARCGAGIPPADDPGRSMDD